MERGMMSHNFPYCSQEGKLSQLNPTCCIGGIYLELEIQVLISYEIELPPTARLNICRHIPIYMLQYVETQNMSPQRFCAQRVHTVKEFRCYEVKIEESEKASSHQESNPGHLWLEPPVHALPLSHNSQTTTNPHNPLHTIAQQ